MLQSKASAATLFLFLLGVSLCNGVWYAYASNGLAQAFSMPGELIGRLIGLAVVFMTWVYTLRLKRSRILI